LRLKRKRRWWKRKRRWKQRKSRRHIRIEGPNGET
jgi:hypothetical protein